MSIMASPRALKLVCLVVMVCMVLGAYKARADLTCQQVVNALIPCVNYVSNGGSVPTECCNGIKGLYSQAKTTSDRQAVCRCIKSAINELPYTGVNVGLASGLPGQCGVNLPYKIDPSTNCDSIK